MPSRSPRWTMPEVTAPSSLENSRNEYCLSLSGSTVISRLGPSSRIGEHRSALLEVGHHGFDLIWPSDERADDIPLLGELFCRAVVVQAIQQRLGAPKGGGRGGGDVASHVHGIVEWGVGQSCRQAQGVRLRSV